MIEQGDLNQRDIQFRFGEHPFQGNPDAMVDPSLSSHRSDPCRTEQVGDTLCEFRRGRRFECLLIVVLRKALFRPTHSALCLFQKLAFLDRQRSRRHWHRSRQMQSDGDIINVTLQFVLAKVDIYSIPL
jgi:hypothetical protein